MYPWLDTHLYTYVCCVCVKHFENYAYEKGKVYYIWQGGLRTRQV